jgi:hypothetical protein
MTNSDWCPRAKQPPRPQPIEIRKRETLCTLRKDEHHVMLDKRDVPAMGEELILSVDCHWRWMRVFRIGKAPLSAAVAETVTRLEAARGWHTHEPHDAMRPLMRQGGQATSPRFSLFPPFL